MVGKNEVGRSCFEAIFGGDDQKCSLLHLWGGGGEQRLKMTVVVSKIPPNAFDGGPDSSENLEPFHQAGFFSWGEVQPLVSAGGRAEFPLRLGP